MPISFGEAAAGMDTGELAVVLLVATSTHMDLTRIVASQPAVLSSEAREGNNRSSKAEQGTLVHCSWVGWEATPLHLHRITLRCRPGLYSLAAC